MNNQDYQKLREKAIEQFKNGKSLFGKDGAFAPMLKSFIQETLQAEMEAHLDKRQEAMETSVMARKRKRLKAQRARLLSILHKIEKVTLSPKSSQNTKQS